MRISAAESGKNPIESPRRGGKKTRLILPTILTVYTIVCLCVRMYTWNGERGGAQPSRYIDELVNEAIWVSCERINLLSLPPNGADGISEKEDRLTLCSFEQDLLKGRRLESLVLLQDARHFALRPFACLFPLSSLGSLSVVVAERKTARAAENKERRSLLQEPRPALIEYKSGRWWLLLLPILAASST